MKLQTALFATILVVAFGAFSFGETGVPGDSGTRGVLDDYVAESENIRAVVEAEYTAFRKAKSANVQDILDVYLELYEKALAQNNNPTNAVRVANAEVTEVAQSRFYDIRGRESQTKLPPGRNANTNQTVRNTYSAQVSWVNARWYLQTLPQEAGDDYVNALREIRATSEALSEKTGRVAPAFSGLSGVAFVAAHRAFTDKRNAVYANTRRSTAIVDSILDGIAQNRKLAPIAGLIVAEHEKAPREIANRPNRKKSWQEIRELANYSVATPDDDIQTFLKSIGDMYLYADAVYGVLEQEEEPFRRRAFNGRSKSGTSSYQNAFSSYKNIVQYLESDESKASDEEKRKALESYRSDDHFANYIGKLAVMDFDERLKNLNDIKVRLDKLETDAQEIVGHFRSGKNLASLDAVEYLDVDRTFTHKFYELLDTLKLAKNRVNALISDTEFDKDAKAFLQEHPLDTYTKDAAEDR